jgi:hypothetical protein
MRPQNARGGARLAPVEDDPKSRNVHTLETRAYDPLFEERLLKAQFARERSSAYWFAASTWGIAGLVAGACGGAYMMYVASVATLPVAQEAVARGMQLNHLNSEAMERNLLDPAAPSGE